MSHDLATMTLVEHLEELRRRLIIIVISVLAAAVVGFVLSRPVLDLLRLPLPEGQDTLIFLSPADAFAAQLKIAGFLGIAFAMPVILFHVWRFVTPGLLPNERRYVWPVMIGGFKVYHLPVPLMSGLLPRMAPARYPPLKAATALRLPWKLLKEGRNPCAE